ncbi:hypothetical protein [Streptomyces sp. NPDC048639]|uniref:hypothetical protein n=1 Tax=Streptomyces sp. NPDC048639 TaxID=3365581 RepID=UPI003718FE62
MGVSQQAAETRRRRTPGGDPTRFGVTRTTRAVGYVHLGPAGDAGAEERDVVGGTIVTVSCR